MARDKKDWDTIEREYCAGQLSIREIAKTYGVTDTAIRKKAKANGWARDLSAKVEAKVRTELVRTEVRTLDKATEKEIVDAAAARVVSIVREHRTEIARMREMVNDLMGQLKGVVGNRAEIEDAIFAETHDDGNVQRRNAMLKAVSLPANAGVLRELAAAMKILVALEREAFNIDGEGHKPGAGDDPVENQSTLETAARILFLMKSAQANAAEQTTA